MPADPSRENGLSLRTLLFMALIGFGKLAGAATFAWDGRAYIPLGLQSRAQSVLRLPERLSGYVVEDPATLHVLTIDDRTLAFSPRSAEVEVRVILRGESGTLYIARASTGLTFYPLLEVERSARPKESEPSPSAESPASPVGMMLRLMQGRPPVGFRVAPSSRLLLQTADFRLDTEQVWSSRHLTGIVASFKRTAQPGNRIEIDPDLIEISIPELGQLRVLGANRYVLDDANPSTAAFLVFVRD